MIESRKPTNALALASFILGILSFTFITSIPAIICGHMALSQIKKKNDTEGRDFAIAGLVLGYMMFWMIFIHVAAMIALSSIIMYSAPDEGKDIEVQEVEVQIREIEEYGRYGTRTRISSSSLSLKKQHNSKYKPKLLSKIEGDVLVVTRASRP